MTLYKEITERLEKRVEILLAENKELKDLNQAMQKRCHRMEELEVIVRDVQRIEGIIKDVEVDARKDDSEWELYKDLWLAEKEYYTKIIEKLEFQVRCQNSY